ncbi:hypothetical protein FOMG_19979 [Fusarium oxysporum f. sp. melonis 26406]|uniref:Uncharacterized protein n=1 Tax=Fusarium oxysporum f. sp. melonis 26406 TaxID=1089452 RepID=W9ZQ27_FUSOX|nr:hypothetical protein FOMG_19979 [Fusarium oxysporum f. sp. melonis 26406]
MQRSAINAVFRTNQAVKTPRREFLKETINFMDIPWGLDRT